MFIRFRGIIFMFKFNQEMLFLILKTDDIIEV